MKMESDEIRGILQPLCEDVQEQISYNREERDQWNSKVRKLLDERNELNRQVKELITEVQGQKALRDDANKTCLLYTSPSPRDYAASRMPSSV